MSTRIAFRARYGPYLHDGPPVDHVDAVHQVETATVVGTITPGVAQQETATIVGTIAVAGAGNAKVTVTAAGMPNSPKAVTFAVSNNDTASIVGGLARAALAADTDVNGFFIVSGAGSSIILTARAKAANDATMNMAIADDTSDGLTEDATSDDTTAGVAPGTGDAAVTVTAAGMDNSPKDLAVPVVAGDDAETVAGKIATALTADVDVNGFFDIDIEGASVALTAKVAADNDGTMNIAVDNDTCTGLIADPTSTHTAAGAAGVVGSGVGKIEKGGEIIDTVSGAHYINARTRLEPKWHAASGLRIIDLGVLNAVDVNAGPVTLYEPEIGEFVAISFSTDGYANHDFNNAGGPILIGQEPRVDYGWLMSWDVDTAVDSLKDGVVGGMAGQSNDAETSFDHNVALGFMTEDEPIVAVGAGAGDGNQTLDRPVGVWDAAHAYATGDFVLGSDNIIYQAQGDGTSDTTEPSWPGAGSTVTDNDFDWLGFATPATAGSIHLYAFVATPAAP